MVTDAHPDSTQFRRIRAPPRGLGSSSTREGGRVRDGRRIRPRGSSRRFLPPPPPTPEIIVSPGTCSGGEAKPHPTPRRSPPAIGSLLTSTTRVGGRHWPDPMSLGAVGLRPDDSPQHARRQNPAAATGGGPPIRSRKKRQRFREGGSGTRVLPDAVGCRAFLGGNRSGWAGGTIGGGPRSSHGISRPPPEQGRVKSMRSRLAVDPEERGLSGYLRPECPSADPEAYPEGAHGATPGTPCAPALALVTRCGRNKKPLQPRPGVRAQHIPFPLPALHRGTREEVRGSLVPISSPTRAPSSSDRRAGLPDGGRWRGIAIEPELGPFSLEWRFWLVLGRCRRSARCGCRAGGGVAGSSVSADTWLHLPPWTPGWRSLAFALIGPPDLGTGWDQYPGPPASGGLLFMGLRWPAGENAWTQLEGWRSEWIGIFPGARALVP